MQMIATRDAYGRALAEFGEKNERIVVLDADLSSSTRSALFGEKFPDRFFNMGIAEANMINTAAGLAASGKGNIPSGAWSVTLSCAGPGSTGTARQCSPEGILAGKRINASA